MKMYAPTLCLVAGLLSAPNAMCVEKDPDTDPCGRRSALDTVPIYPSNGTSPASAHSSTAIWENPSLGLCPLPPSLPTDPGDDAALIDIDIDIDFSESLLEVAEEAPPAVALASSDSEDVPLVAAVDDSFHLMARPHGQDSTEDGWALLAPLVYRACLLLLFLFLMLHSRQIIKEMTSSLASATAFESLIAALEVSISRLQQQVEVQLGTLSRYPSLLVSLDQAVTCLNDLELAIDDQIEDDFSHATGHLQAVIADHDETGALEDEFDTLQCSLEELRTSSAEAEVAADEELVLLMADFIESEHRLEAAEDKTFEHAVTAASLEDALQVARADCHSLLAGKDIFYKHLACLHHIDRLEAQEHTAELANLKSERMALAVCYTEALSCADATAHKADALAEGLEHLLTASHFAQQALVGDIADASCTLVNVTSDIAKDETRREQLADAYAALQATSSELDVDIKTLETSLAELDAEKAALDSASTKEIDEHDQQMTSLVAEREKLAASHAATLAELSLSQRIADQIAQETAALVSTLREKLAAEKQQFEDNAAALRASTAKDDAAIAAHKSACLALETSIKTGKAELDARCKVFNARAEEYDRNMEAAWDLGKESGYDKQQYESMLEEASNKAARARKQQAEAEQKAAAARAHSDEVAKETAVTKHAFTMQLRDLEAERATLSSGIAALEAVDRKQLRADTEALRTTVDGLKRTYEARKRMLEQRLHAAQADLERFAMREVDAVNRLNAQIAGLAAEEVALQTKMADYKSEVMRVHDAVDRARRELSEARDALAVERSQAEALLGLIQRPSTDPVFVAACASLRASSVASEASLSELESDLGCSAIFDASFEEAA